MFRGQKPHQSNLKRSDLNEIEKSLHKKLKLLSSLDKVSPSIRLNDFEYPKDIDGIKNSLLHKSEYLTDMINKMMVCDIVVD